MDDAEQSTGGWRGRLDGKPATLVLAGVVAVVGLLVGGVAVLLAVVASFLPTWLAFPLVPLWLVAAFVLPRWCLALLRPPSPPDQPTQPGRV